MHHGESRWEGYPKVIPRSIVVFRFGKSLNAAGTLTFQSVITKLNLPRMKFRGAEAEAVTVVHGNVELKDSSR